jgi:hypothetical protein
MLAEFDKLQIKSDTLTQQIELLAAPITKLSNEELTLLKTPIVGISDKDPSSLKASLSVAKNSEQPVSNTNPQAPKPSPPPQRKSTDSAAKVTRGNISEPGVETSSKPSVPEIKNALQNNLCRCGTHMRILRAVHRAARLIDTAELSSTTKGIVHGSAP